MSVVPLTSVKKPKLMPANYYHADPQGGPGGEIGYDSNRGHGIDGSPRDFQNNGGEIVASPIIGNNRRSRGNNKKISSTLEDQQHNPNMQ